MREKALFVLGGLALVGEVVLVALGHDIPAELGTVTTVLAGAVAGVSLPVRQAS